MTVSPSLINMLYVVASVLFILDLKWMSHPRTAVRGNWAGAVGMLIAVVAALWSMKTIDTKYIALGLAIGTIIGWITAVRIAMTAMPEMVGLFNGFGGAASVLVAAAALIADKEKLIASPDLQMQIATVASAVIGSVTFFGSYVAFGKLAEFLAVKWKLNLWQSAIKYGFSATCAAGGIGYAWHCGGSPEGYGVAAGGILSGLVLLHNKNSFPGMNALKIATAAATLAISIWVTLHPENEPAFWLLVAVSGLLGVLLTFGIGGADMPVVIALLNSYSGIAAAATGFIIDNTVLIIAGSLVGASGVILTQIMCKAMNRSLTNVLFGALGPTAETPDADEVYKSVKSTSADEIAMMLETARRVVIVPGYGMAVSQAQHAVRDLANLIESKYGSQVEFAIHPVAGRMPGHMNVLLAEANVPYEQLKEMDEINPTMQSVDVALVIGANDVVNPDAKNNPNSPIAGMPVIDVDKARTVIVIKRSLSPGFAGIPNPLFAAENTMMFFNDGKKAILEIVNAIKAT